MLGDSDHHDVIPGTCTTSTRAAGWTIAIVLLAVLLLLAPPLSAGTAQDPEVSDAEGDAEPVATNEFADVTAGWIEEGNDTLTTQIQLASFPAVPPDGELYIFNIQDEAQPECIFSFTRVWYRQGAWSGAVGKVNACTFNILEDQEVPLTAPTSGSPLVTVEFPRSWLNASAEGTVLGNLSVNVLNANAFTASAVDPDLGNRIGDEVGFHDRAQGERSYVLGGGEAPDEDGQQNATDASPNATGGSGSDAPPSEDPESPASDPDDSGASGVPGPRMLAVVVSLSAAATVRRRWR